MGADLKRVLSEARYARDNGDFPTMRSRVIELADNYVSEGKVRQAGDLCLDFNLKADAEKYYRQHIAHFRKPALALEEARKLASKFDANGLVAELSERTRAEFERLRANGDVHQAARYAKVLGLRCDYENFTVLERLETGVQYALKYVLDENIQVSAAISSKIVDKLVSEGLSEPAVAWIQRYMPKDARLIPLLEKQSQWTLLFRLAKALGVQEKMLLALEKWGNTKSTLELESAALSAEGAGLYEQAADLYARATRVVKARELIEKHNLTGYASVLENRIRERKKEDTEACSKLAENYLKDGMWHYALKEANLAGRKDLADRAKKMAVESNLKKHNYVKAAEFVLKFEFPFEYAERIVKTCLRHKGKKAAETLIWKSFGNLSSRYISKLESLLRRK